MRSPEYFTDIAIEELQKLLHEHDGIVPAEEKYRWILDGDVLTAYYRKQAIDAIAYTDETGNLISKLTAHI